MMTEKQFKDFTKTVIGDDKVPYMQFLSISKLDHYLKVSKGSLGMVDHLHISKVKETNYKPERPSKIFFDERVRVSGFKASIPGYEYGYKTDTVVKSVQQGKGVVVQTNTKTGAKREYIISYDTATKTLTTEMINHSELNELLKGAEGKFAYVFTHANYAKLLAENDFNFEQSCQYITKITFVYKLPEKFLQAQAASGDATNEAAIVEQMWERKFVIDFSTDDSGNMFASIENSIIGGKKVKDLDKTRGTVTIGHSFVPELGYRPMGGFLRFNKQKITFDHGDSGVVIGHHIIDNVGGFKWGRMNSDRRWGLLNIRKLLRGKQVQFEVPNPPENIRGFYG